MRKPARIILLLALLSPISAMALGLGNIKLNSALNQPLDAEIALVSASASELDSLRVSLASADAFASYGLDRPAFLLGMRFRVVRDGAGGAVVRVATDQPVREPFVTFLVEADWARGRLLREYTVLLDPPVFMNEPPAASPSATPAATQPTSGAVSRETPPSQVSPQPSTPAPAPARTDPRPSPQADSGLEGMSTRYGPIRRNETLWTIASRLRPEREISVNQMMIAIFRENPQAFVGNINRLRQGAVLRVPTRADIYALSANEAFAEVRRQNAAWRGSRPATPSSQAATGTTGSSTSDSGSGRLRLVPPGDASREQGARSGQDSVADSELAGNSALTQRIRSLEGELENARRLIDVKDSELSALQARLEALEARLDAEAAAAASDSGTVADTAAEPGAEPDAESAAADVATEAETAEPEADPAVAEPPAVVDTPPAVVTAPGSEAEGKGFFGSIFSFLAGAWVWILGLLAIALAGAFVFLMRGRSAEGDYSESWETGEWKAPEAAADVAVAQPPVEPESSTDTQPAPKFDGDDSFVVVEAEDTITEESLRPEPPADVDEFTAALGDAFEDTGTFTPGELEVEKAEQAEPQEDDAADYPFEDTMIGHDALKLDESDPVAEADFHMAYGLYDQAAALIERAAEKDPGNRELKMKLMEIFFVWGNQERFLEESQAFKKEVGDAGAGDWEKIAIMGKQLMPDNDLYVNTEATGVFSAPDLEFAMEGDDDASATATDLDFLGGADEGDTINEEGADDLAALKEKIENQVEPSEETLDLGSSHVGLDLDFESDAVGDANNESTAVNENIAADDADGGTVEAAGEGTLDEDLEIDLDFQFEDVSDDEPTAVLEDINEQDVADMLADVDDDSATRIQQSPDDSATRMQESLDDSATRMQEGIDDDATRVQESFDDSATRMQEGLDDEATRMQEGLDDEATRMQEGLDDSATRIQQGPSSGDEDETRVTDTSDFDPFSDDDEMTRETPLGGSDDHGGTMQMARVDLDEDDLKSSGDDAGDDATRQIKEMDHNFGGDETVQISSSDEARFADPNSDLTTQLPSGAGPNGQDFLDDDFEDDDSDSEPTQKLKALEMPDNEPLDEVGTKLDLAKAFVDMGDPEGARNILEEVMDEGNDSQRQEAKGLLDNLGG